MSKVYEINTIQDIMDCVTPENVNRFLEEFSQAIRANLMVKSAAELSGVEGFDEDYTFGPIKWTDDGDDKIEVILKPL